MATVAYLNGRKRYTRPQAVIWSENPGTLSASGIYIPTGQEIGANPLLATTSNPANQFLILSDHNRSPLQFKPTRIEQRQRMINGNMRSHHIADKTTISFSWDNLPSRAYAYPADFDASGLSDQPSTNEYTVDGGAGGVELLDWYENHKGPFWMFLSYDKYNNFGSSDQDSTFLHLTQYTEIMQVYFSDFSYDVVKRGRATHDFWNVSVSLEEL
jgi:hypothetical protein